MTEQQPVPHPTFQDRHGQTWYVWKDTAVLPHVADMYTDRKRLTDPELAAEYWKQAESAATIAAYGGQPIRASRKITILERFATLPHASANGYQ